MTQSFFKVFLKSSLFFILSFFAATVLAEKKLTDCKILFLGLKPLPETPESVHHVSEVNRSAKLEAKKEPNFESVIPLPPAGPKPPLPLEPTLQKEPKIEKTDSLPPEPNWGLNTSKWTNPPWKFPPEWR